MTLIATTILGVLTIPQILILAGVILLRRVLRLVILLTLGRYTLPAPVLHDLLQHEARTWGPSWIRKREPPGRPPDEGDSS